MSEAAIEAREYAQRGWGKALRAAALWKRLAKRLRARSRETTKMYRANVRERNVQAMEFERIIQSWKAEELDWIEAQKSMQAEVTRSVQLPTITPSEKEILDAAKALSCKPVRRIENGFDPDGPESMPAPTGMMLLGGRGEIRKVCEAVIRWRASQDSGLGAGETHGGPLNTSAELGLPKNERDG